jgi:hypothetical protein
MQFSTSHTEQIVQTEFLSTTDLTIREVSNWSSWLSAN